MNYENTFMYFYGFVLIWLIIRDHSVDIIVINNIFVNFYERQYLRWVFPSHILIIMFIEISDVRAILSQ